MIYPGRSAEDYDESDVRIRPNRRGSRPRTKERPKHEDAITGFVVAIDRGRYTVLVGGLAARLPGDLAGGLGDHLGGEAIGGPVGPLGAGVTVHAMRARELGRKGIAVGDRVGLVGDVRGGPDALARIVRIEPRSSVLRRTADDTDPVERVIVANAAQLVVVVAAANPQPRPRMIDRCLVAAYDAGLDPLLVLTKSDLADPGELLDTYEALAVPCVITRVTREGIDHLDQLADLLDDRVSVLVGHSGVGKSTLVNALVPDAHRAVGIVNDITGRGRHTSSSAIALPLPSGGWVIDTPGVRSFGLAHVDPASIISHFPELLAGTDECPRACGHDEPDCGLDDFVEAGGAGPSGAARLESLRRLLRARSGEPD